MPARPKRARRPRIEIVGNSSFTNSRPPHQNALRRLVAQAKSQNREKNAKPPRQNALRGFVAQARLDDSKAPVIQIGNHRVIATTPDGRSSKRPHSAHTTLSLDSNGNLLESRYDPNKYGASGSTSSGSTQGHSLAPTSVLVERANLRRHLSRSGIMHWRTFDRVFEKGE